MQGHKTQFISQVELNSNHNISDGEASISVHEGNKLLSKRAVMQQT